jgi:glyoxylase-like metal-dependent hydrolase (beta-lactamase superfamily II)
MESLVFNRAAPAHYGEAVRLSPRVRRIMANNPGPMTFSGTAIHLIGEEELAIMDPGPEDTAHINALLQSIGKARVTHIFVTHTHRDHTGAVDTVRQATGALVVGCAPHQGYDSVASPISHLEASVDDSFSPDIILRDGEHITGKGWTLEAVATPGHTANHLCFSLREEQALFSGDHVMAWSTTVIAPPVGAMGPYMSSLRKLLNRQDMVYYPAHGMPITDPVPYTAALLRHREHRRDQIEKCLSSGLLCVEAIAKQLYPHIDPQLERAAALIVAAHLDELLGSPK